MISRFVKAWEEGKDALREQFTRTEPEVYQDIVKGVVGIISPNDPDDYESPDSERVHTLNDGHYRGTLVFVIGGRGYQPRLYWYVKVSYGSCSGCDTFYAIRDNEDAEGRIDGYMTLALHIVQGLKAMQEEEVKA